MTFLNNDKDKTRTIHFPKSFYETDNLIEKNSGQKDQAG